MHDEELVAILAIVSIITAAAAANGNRTRASPLAEDGGASQLWRTTTANGLLDGSGAAGAATMLLLW